MLFLKISTYFDDSEVFIRYKELMESTMMLSLKRKAKKLPKTFIFFGI
jgi:hypothetical protein